MSRSEFLFAGAGEQSALTLATQPERERRQAVRHRVRAVERQADLFGPADAVQLVTDRGRLTLTAEDVDRLAAAFGSDVDGWPGARVAVAGDQVFPLRRVAAADVEQMTLEDSE